MSQQEVSPITNKEWDAIASAEQVIEDEETGQEPKPTDDDTGKDKAELRGMVAQLVIAGGGMMAQRRGSHWIISEQEAEMIAEPLSEILSELGMIAESPEIRLAIASAFVLLPRMMVDSKRSKGDKAKKVKHEETKEE